MTPDLALLLCIVLSAGCGKGSMKVDIRKRLRQIPWKLFLGVVVFVLFAGAGAAYGVARWMERDLPPIEQVEAYRAAIKSSVYDASGKLLHEFFRENRANLRLTEIPDNLITAAHVMMGYPERGFPASLSRRPLSEVAFAESYGQPLASA